MADLILEFGCSPCYLQDLNCGADCTFELRIDLNQLFFSAPYAFDLGIDLNQLSSSALSQPYFHQCADRTFIVKKEFFRARIPDVYRYDLRYCQNNSQWELCLSNSTGTQQLAGIWTPKTIANYRPFDTPIENDESAKNILIILESPHDEEYDYASFTPLQPANGATGINFFTHFTDDILKYTHNTNMPTSLEEILCTQDIYRICFVNPVPFQTSLHFFHGKPLKEGVTKDLRDIVWKKLFIHCQSDFIRRLQLYKPFAILNACTKDLKGQVKAAVGNHSSIHQFETAHPSSWSRKENNRYCKKW